MSENNNSENKNSTNSDKEKEIGWGDEGAAGAFVEGLIEGTVDGLVSPFKWIWGGLGGDAGNK